MPISREESEKTSETRKSREISEEEILNFLKKNRDEAFTDSEIPAKILDALIAPVHWAIYKKRLNKLAEEGKVKKKRIGEKDHYTVV